jgi:hypothetical protein
MAGMTSWRAVKAAICIGTGAAMIGLDPVQGAGVALVVIGAGIWIGGRNT